jgi:outer membrane cobalamin receptor
VFRRGRARDWGNARAQVASSVNDDDEFIELERLVVTANRTPTEKGKVGSTVEEVTKEEIEEKALPTVVDYLNLLPGVATSRALCRVQWP